MVVCSLSSVFMYTEPDNAPLAELSRMLESTSVDLSAARDQLVSHKKLSLHINPQAARLAKLELGESRLGGRPDLPADFDWPHWKGRELSFLAQIDLASLPTPDSALPSEGWLAFFGDTEAQTWGFEKGDFGSWVVRYFRGDRTQLVRAPAENPSVRDSQIRVYRPTMTPAWDLPNRDCKEWWSGAIKKFNHGELEVLDEEFFAWSDEHGHIGHKLLGYPYCVQHDLQSSTHEFTHAILRDKGISQGSPEWKQALDSPDDWILLAQFDCQEELGWMWGDSGFVYFCIRQRDLEARNFNDTWTVLQCY